ncbi:PPE family protein [Nocardia sp. NBC_00403]|uniref:PPE family protein n=1 Tax=Nocardia sp. NBC_00403 TaxID=2975990 RepID=UPI002E1EEF76
MTSPGDALIEAGLRAALAAMDHALRALAMLPATAIFAAQPLEILSFRLTCGLGTAPMLNTANGYKALSAGLTAAADSSEGSTKALSVAWEGPSSDRAQAAYRHHAVWLRDQAKVADTMAVLATRAAGAYATAFAAMPPLDMVRALDGLRVGLAAANTVGQTSGLMLAAELAYDLLWAQAIVTMATYAGTAIELAAEIPSPTVPPTIVPVGENFQLPPLLRDHTPGHKYVPLDRGPGNTGDGSGNGNGDHGNGNNGNGNGNGDNGGGGDGNGDGDPGTDPGKPTPEQPAQQLPEPEQAASDLNNGMSNMADRLGGSSGEGLSPEDLGFYGASPYSSTLAGLNGGSGSMVALGMMRGGIGSMPGASTGFRMPANWSLGPGTAYGATPISGGTGPASRGTAPRRVVAPKANMRRRRKDEDRRKSKVFVPGEPQDVPVLEQAPVIGVIEYDDADHQDDPIAAEAVLVGVIEQAEDDSAQVLVDRPR